jgi:hypothetical protein
VFILGAPAEDEPSQPMEVLETMRDRIIVLAAISILGAIAVVHWLPMGSGTHAMRSDPWVFVNRPVYVTWCWKDQSGAVNCRRHRWYTGGWVRTSWLKTEAKKPMLKHQRWESPFLPGLHG